MVYVINLKYTADQLSGALFRYNIKKSLYSIYIYIYRKISIIE